MFGNTARVIMPSASLTSVVSYPERGNYGNNKWRGNCSGELIKDLLNWYQPKKAFDPMVGSGTFLDVCQELGVDHYALDLNPAYGGWDALNDEIPESSDFTFFHPPYHNMITYSGNMWGEADPRDLSRCFSYEDFIKKLNHITAKLLSSLRKGGRLAVLVGDYKKKGQLYSIQKDMIWPGTPEQVIIKLQHNAESYKTNYSGKFIPIVHEYVLIFRRDDCYIVPLKTVNTVDVDLRTRVHQTWRDVVHAALESLGGKAPLSTLYNEIAGHAKCSTNPNWQAKVRQILNTCKDFINVDKGIWSFTY